MADGSTPKRKISDDKGPRRKRPKLRRRTISGTRLGTMKKYEIAVAYKKRKYMRGERVNIDKIGDKKLRSKLVHQENLISDAVDQAARSEMLMLAEPGSLKATDNEKTWQYTQEEIKEAVDITSASKIFDLDLPQFGPYVIKYSSNGLFILLAGRKGHVALFNWKTNKLCCELHLRETVRDVSFLHNETMFAVAQKRYVYIYDKQGTEIHRLKKHQMPMRVDFLPYHFLMVTVDKYAHIRWQDTSTGDFVAEHNTGQGRCRTMTMNHYNAVTHLGLINGTVTLWSPNVSQPLVKMLCHKGDINDIAINRAGNVMVTAGLDGTVKIWDLRMYKEMQVFRNKRPIQTLDISHTGILATGNEQTVQLWKNYTSQTAEEPYMRHILPSRTPNFVPIYGSGKTSFVSSVKFCPYEDVLGIGHDHGFSSIIVPGAGEPNFDTNEANPYQTVKQRRETTVVRLLEKIPADMICLNPDEIGTVVQDPEAKLKEHQQDIFDKKFPGKEWSPKYRARGRSTATLLHAKKQQSVLDRKSEGFDEDRIRKEEEAKEKSKKRKELPPEPVNALERFKK